MRQGRQAGRQPASADGEAINRCMEYALFWVNVVTQEKRPRVASLGWTRIVNVRLRNVYPKEKYAKKARGMQT
jgi:hypothetical protein